MMSDDIPAAAPKKSGKKKLILIGGAAIALLGGGGVAAGMLLAGHGKGGAPEIDHPKLVVREGMTGDVHAGGSTGTGPFDHSKYKASYAPIEQSFTSNLRNSDAVLQLTVGVATYYDQRVLDAVKANDTPIRSAVLLALADEDPDAIATPVGKKALQNTLKSAINGVLVNKEGFGGVDDVYFTSFIIQ